MQLLVSLHDVTPAHLARLERAEALFRGAGVTRVAYFLVPDFHRRHPIAGDPAFRNWCAKDRPYAIDWVLHGHDHLELPTARASGRGGARTWMKRALLTGGEGEFLALSATDQRARLAWGVSAVRSIGIDTPAFVAPAWLFNDALLPALAAAGFRYTEDHWHVTEVPTGRTRRCPVISWATRTRIRRAGSRVVCPALLRAWRHLPAIRIAVHPRDLDYRPTIASIERVLGAALETRCCAGHADLFD